MLIVAGLTLKNLYPRVWDLQSPYYVPSVRAVMVSYAEFHHMPNKRKVAMEMGLHKFLGIGSEVAIYLDNGAFAFLAKGGEVPRPDYEKFVAAARPDWYAIPQDYIPTPAMTDEEQRLCLEKTMEVNRMYRHDGYVPVIHISRQLDRYLEALQGDERLHRKPVIGLGAMVPNLLRAPKAVPYAVLLDGIRKVRHELHATQLHAFGVGGTATVHLAALLGLDSLDSAGWRNRAARGIVQLRGRGDRVVSSKAMGTWRGRMPDGHEWELLHSCECPACRTFHLEGLRVDGLHGFCNRATHNLWTLLHEATQVERHLQAGSYRSWYEAHLDNSIYLPLIREAVTHAIP